MPSDNFTLFGAARYTPPDNSRTFYLACAGLQDVYERRIIERKRPGLDGAPLDDSGENPASYDLTLLFTTRSTGIANVPTPSYPDYHREAVAALRQKGTSTLYVPGRGEKRVRILRVTSTQSPGERDFETVMISVKEDLEDERITASSFVLPSAKSAGPVLVRQFVDDANAIGIGSDIIDAIERGITAITAAANAPFDSIAALQQRVDDFLGACDRCEAAMLRGPQLFGGGVAPGLPAEATSVRRSLSQMRDTARAQVPAAYGTSTVRERRFGQDLSIFEIATRLQQSTPDLVALNSRLPSLLRIPAGTPVLTRAS